MYNVCMSEISELHNTPKVPIESSKETIDRIIQQDKVAFDAWLQDPEHLRRLDMPKEALRHLLIPRRVLELAGNPEAVDVIVLGQDYRKVTAYTVERKLLPVTDKKRLEEYWKEVEILRSEHMKKLESGEIDVFADWVPEDIDKYHAENEELIGNGTLTLYDAVLLDVSLSIDEDKTDQLTVGYFDRQHLRNTGGATSFYKQLHSSALEMGMRFILGGNNKSNVRYFINKLGRVSLSMIRPGLREVFHSKPDITDQYVYTIDFLHPEDRDEFVDETAS